MIQISVLKYYLFSFSFVGIALKHYQFIMLDITMKSNNIEIFSRSLRLDGIFNQDLYSLYNNL